ncbi:MarR family transcriptional regulator [Caulobacter sp. 1776]|uniref:MarR family winged helix-turn-helix transcriptional regulator n=1 Tax=Caulobacter sp. 1776 TaxID=3156420 RepID=UPI0033918BA3
MSRSVGQQLSFALYSAANRMARLHKPVLEPLGLTFPQYLAILELLDAAPLSVGALGARLDMDTGTITPLVKRLEGEGLVRRRRDPTDERRVLVDLTPRARAMDNDVRAVTGQIQTACRLTDEDQEALRATLDDLAHPAPASAPNNQDHEEH